MTKNVPVLSVNGKVETSSAEELFKDLYPCCILTTIQTNKEEQKKEEEELQC
jgi:hypothetical protein